MKIIVDMNMSPKWVDFFIENDIDAVFFLQ